MDASCVVCDLNLQVAAMFESMIKEILSQVGGLSSQNPELCALLRNILQVKELSIHFKIYKVCITF